VVPPTTNDCGVVFVLWNADTDTVVGPLKDQLLANAVFCLPNYSFSLEAKPSAGCDLTVKSAYLNIDGVEGGGYEGDGDNTVPYTLFGDAADGDIFDDGGYELKDS